MTPDNQLPSLLGREVRAHIGIEEYQGRRRNVVKYYMDDGKGLPSLLAELLLSNWAGWLEENPCPAKLPAPEPSINGWWLPKAASACLFFKLPPDWAVKLIRRAMTRLENGPREVERTVERIYGGKVSSTESTVERVEPYNPALLIERARRLPAEIRDDLVNWLASVSPGNIDVGPADFLNAVFPGEKVLATTNMLAKGGFIYESPDEVKEMERFVAYNTNGAWYLANPINGEWINDSIRSEANLTSFHHIVLESDAAPADQWLAMLVQEPLAIVALSTSGNRSIHALVRIPAKNKAQFDRVRSEIRRRYVPLGADPAAMSAVRLTRLPGVVRRDKGNVQRLLYLNPRPSVREIYRCPEKKKPSTSNQLIEGKELDE
jgi:hypothetical protein